MSGLYHGQPADAPIPEPRAKLWELYSPPTLQDIRRESPEQYAARCDYAYWCRAHDSRSRSRLWTQLVKHDGARRLGETLAFKTIPRKDGTPKTALHGAVALTDEQLAKEFKLKSVRTIQRWRDALKETGLIDAHKCRTGFAQYQNSIGKPSAVMHYRLDYCRIMKEVRILYGE